MMALFPILTQKLVGLPVILLMVTSIVNYIALKKNSFDNQKLIIAIIPFFIFLLSAFYSDHFVSAFKKVSGTKLSLLVVPLAFFLMNKSTLKYLKSKFYKFQIAFSISSLLLCIFYFSYLPFIEASQNPHFAFPSGFFFKAATEKIPYFHLEPVYFSFLIVISLINSVSLYVQKHINLFHFIIFGIFYLSVILLMTSKLAILFAMLFSVWSVFFILKNKIFKVALIIVMLFSLYPLTQIPSIKYEIEEVQYFLEGKKRAKDDSTQKRYRITISSLDLAKEINLLIGTGIGDVQKELNNVYELNKYKELLVKKFDSHNQYLSMFLGTGLIGLIGLIIHLAILIKVAIKKKFIFGFWVISFIIIQMLTETVLERQVPVIIYSLSISLILFFPKKCSDEIK
jgi:hypothetical protein